LKSQERVIPGLKGDEQYKKRGKKSGRWWDRKEEKNSVKI